MHIHFKSLIFRCNHFSRLARSKEVYNEFNNSGQVGELKMVAILGYLNFIDPLKTKKID